MNSQPNHGYRTLDATTANTVRSRVDDQSLLQAVPSARPGITDCASIETADENEVLAQYDDTEQAYRTVILPRKLQYCEVYVQNRSLWQDVRIIGLTIKRILRF